MNYQECFNKIWQHAVVEKNPPGWNNELGRCRYRGDKGTKCFIGVLISDDIYDPLMEQKSATELFEQDFSANLRKSLEFSNFSHNNITFVSLLQSSHDGNARGYYEGVKRLRTAEEFSLGVEQSLRAVALRFGLSIPENKKSVEIVH